MSYTDVGTTEMDETQSLEATFDEALKLRSEAEQRINKGRLEDLHAFETQHFHSFYQPNVLSETKAQINKRLRQYGSLIQPPHGPVTIFLDFVDSHLSNGMTFVQDGKYFIGVSSQMLLDFDRACVALAGNTAQRRCTSSPVHRGKTATARASTPSSEMSSSTVRSSTR
jgi:hypothetical protein